MSKRTVVGFIVLAVFVAALAIVVVTLIEDSRAETPIGYSVDTTIECGPHLGWMAYTDWDSVTHYIPLQVCDTTIDTIPAVNILEMGPYPIGLYGADTVINCDTGLVEVYGEFLVDCDTTITLYRLLTKGYSTPDGVWYFHRDSCGILDSVLIEYNAPPNPDSCLTIVHPGEWIIADWFNNGEIDSIWVSPGLVPYLDYMVNPWFGAWNACEYCSLFVEKTKAVPSHRVPLEDR